jgi:hypothetical protein
VLEELNRLMLDLRHSRARVPAPPPTLAPPAPPPPPSAAAAATEVPPTPDRWGVPSPFLEERMEVALQAATGLVRDVDDLERRSRGLRETIATLEQELGQATRELAWVRSVYGGDASPEPDAAPSVSTSPGERPPSVPSLRSPATVAASLGGRRETVPPSPYGGFTVSRYNDTVNDIKRRRPSVAAITVLVSVAISVVLVALTLIYGEPMPVVWLAVLPIVWLIPVPFFVAAFWGTQRVLRRNHLTLPGGP